MEPKFSGSIKQGSEHVVLNPALFAVDKDAPSRSGVKLFNEALLLNSS